jgi:hypothetical protein
MPWFMARSSPLLVPALVVLAVAGWGWGFYQSVGDATPGEPDAEGVVKSSRIRSRQGAPPPSISSLLPTARSARLFSSLDEIAAEPQGGVNQKLLAAMRTTFADNDPTRRARDFAILLDLMRPDDAQAVHELFLELHRNGQTLGEYAPFANRWGQIDGAGALETLINEKPLRLPERDLRSILVGWSTQDPQAAIAWLESHPEVPGALDNFDAVIQGWINLDRDAATRYLIEQPVGWDDRVRATRNAADEILSASGVDATITWLTSFPPNQANLDAATAAFDAISWRLNELPYDTAATVWASLSANSIGRIDQLERFTEATGMARQATNGSRGFIDALAATWPIEDASARFTAWSQQDPERVKNFLSEHADSPFIQSIREQLAAGGFDFSARRPPRSANSANGGRPNQDPFEAPEMED